MKKRFLAVILACALTLAVAAGCGSDEKSKSSNAGSTADSAAKTDITFVLDWTPNTNHTGVYVAKEKGYFADAGINVEVVQPPEDGAEALVSSGKAQFGVSFQDYLVPLVAGDTKAPIEAVAALVQHNTSGIISLTDKNIKTPRDLEGKSYATWELPIEQATLKRVVEADSGDFSKVNLVPETVTDEVSALQAGKIDAIWIFYGWAGIACEQAKLKTNYFAFKDIDPVFDFYTPVVVGNTDWMKENSDTAKKFLSALKKGYEFAIDHPSDAADILLKNAPELDEKLVKASQEYLSKNYKAEVEQWGYIDPARWNAFYNWINENKLSDAVIPDNAGFTNDYLE